ncbi:MAG: tripartite tricarboxylate transporter substrate binding protein [Burkholderiaceae bacterium]|jgi:tripartite-type tricarboxylate transporter receptor subunit TctC|nr:tripartite tricarboxylate transporter substrate binding protein [Burkholderiaceae bacterium]
MIATAKIFRALACAAALMCACAAAIAADFPSKPVKLIVPYGAGGTIDLVGRMLGPRLHALLGQPVIVENKPGGGTTIGADAVARAEPDGHTLFLGSNAAFTIGPQVMAKVPYDPLRSFAAVGTLANFPNLILVKPDSPYKTLAEVVQAARATPGKFSYASFGIGSTAQLSGEGIKVAAGGADIAEVPYKSGAQCVQAILSGEVNYGFDTAIGSVQRVKSGQLRALAVTSSTRLPSLPDVPSIAEAGFPGTEVVAWIALFAPAGTPAPVLKKLEGAFQTLMKDTEVQQKLTEMGIEISFLSGDATMQMMRDEYARFGKLIEKAGIRSAE